MNKLFLIAVIIAVLALVASAKSLICAQCQTEQCLTLNNCHLARSGLLGSTLLEEDEEQKWSGWKKIENAAKKVGKAMKDTNINISLEEEDDVEEQRERMKLNDIGKKINDILKNIDITISLEDEMDEQKWSGWKKIENAAKKVGKVMKDTNINISLEEDEEGELDAEQKWKGWKKIGKFLGDLNVNISFENDEADYVFDEEEEEGEFGFQSSGAHIAAVAKNHLGVKYVYGGSSWGSGVDCSGFTMLVVKEATGISLPRTADAQRGVGTTVHGVANARPGDLVFFPGHVTIYVGNNQVAHAPHTGSVTKVATIWQTPQLIKRLV
jgi:cell wall-associated NlpC family hydrolase